MEDAGATVDEVAHAVRWRAQQGLCRDRDKVDVSAVRECEPALGERAWRPLHEHDHRIRERATGILQHPFDVVREHEHVDIPPRVWLADRRAHEQHRMYVLARGGPGLQAVDHAEAPV